MKLVLLGAFLTSALTFAILFVIVGIVGVENLSILAPQLERIMQFSVIVSLASTLLTSALIYFEYDEE